MTTASVRVHRLSWPAAGAALVLAAGAAASVAAQPQPAGPKPDRPAPMRQACAADVRKLCPDVPRTGGGLLLNCLREKADQVSPGCKEAVKSIEAPRRQPAAP